MKWFVATRVVAFGVVVACSSVAQASVSCWAGMTRCETYTDDAKGKKACTGNSPSTNGCTAPEKGDESPSNELLVVCNGKDKSVAHFGKNKGWTKDKLEKKCDKGATAVIKAKI